MKFGVNTARSFLGKNVNLHLKDGSVIVNVQVEDIQKDDYQRESLIKCVPYGNGHALMIPLRNIAWARTLNVLFSNRHGVLTLNEN